MKKMLLFGIALFIAIGIFAGKDDLQIRALRFLLTSQVGFSKDYFIMKRTMGDGDPAPVILVFGYVDDLSVCQGMLKAMRRNPETFGDPNLQETMYFCERAN